MKIEIIEPIGYCSGVSNAIAKAISVRKEFPNKSIYILGSLVHNSHVIDSLESIGIKSITDSITSLQEKINSLEDDCIVVFTAHGHDEKVDEIALKKRMKIIDCICPKVKANMTQIKRNIEEGNEVIFVGIKNHPETLARLSISSKVPTIVLTILYKNLEPQIVISTVSPSF